MQGNTAIGDQDTRDLKSCGRKPVRVRSPPSAPFFSVKSANIGRVPPPNLSPNIDLFQ